MFFDNEKELLKSADYTNIEIVFGEPDISTIHLMKNLRWIQMTWAGADVVIIALPGTAETAGIKDYSEVQFSM